jgi:hypothetical protein
MEKPRLFGMNGFIVILLSCFCFGAYAQQAVGLILIDAEGKQPFTVRIGNQVYPSSVHGHLTLSHLKDSSYRLCLRFPKKALAEQIFPVNLRQKDLGFILKGEDSSWVLYNWQTKETIHPVYILDSSRILELGVKREDGFSRLMASVVNDTAVMYNTYTGSGFHGNDTSAIGHKVFPIGQTSSPNNQQPSTTVAAPAITNAQLSNVPAEKPPAVSPPATAVSTGVVANTPKKPDKDSLVAVRRQQTHTRDSLQAVRKAFLKDSMLTVRAEKASKDSLQAVRKTFLKDSLRQAKKFTNDSLLAAKLKRDSLATINKKQAGGQPANATALPAAAIPPASDAGGESRVLTAAKDSQSLIGKNPPAADRRVSMKPAIPPKKIREVSLKISRKIVFVDVNSEGKKDTITLFVYFENQELPVKVPEAGPVANKSPSGRDSISNIKSQVKIRPVDSVGLKKTSTKTKFDSAAAKKASVRNLPAKAGQSICPDLASDADILFLRSAILKANTDQEKIAVATGGFALKCFSVTQIRQLAALFVADKSRYRLMEAARSHIADQEHFPELADMYTDKNFQRKFLVMAEKGS